MVRTDWKATLLSPGPTLPVHVQDGGNLSVRPSKTTVVSSLQLQHNSTEIQSTLTRERLGGQTRAGVLKWGR